jgi:hypothetical protein
MMQPRPEVVVTGIDQPRFSVLETHQILPGMPHLTMLARAEDNEADALPR